MFGTNELDSKNTYQPKLSDINESALRTFGEANSFFRKEELYLQDVERRIKSGELVNPEDIYDECHAIASDLAKCSEMYLKALYLYENNVPGETVDHLWEKLKNSEFQCDSNGNLLYQNSNGVITHAKYDANGNPLYDKTGKMIYEDDAGNQYNENQRGSKIKRNGHQLDRLIELMSSDSRLLLEARILTIPMSNTEEFDSVSIIDLLQEKGKITQSPKMTVDDYNSKVLKHKKTFEEARYSGEKYYDVNVTFLYHLTKQIKAVVQYKMAPTNEQVFSLTDTEIAKLPKEIEELVRINASLMSEDLLKIILCDEEVKARFIKFCSNEFFISTDMNQKTFCSMLILMDTDEIIYCLYLRYFIDNYDVININEYSGEEKVSLIKLKEIILLLKCLNITSENILDFLIQIKLIFKKSLKIQSETFMILLVYLNGKYAKKQDNNYKYVIEKIENDINKLELKKI